MSQTSDDPIPGEGDPVATGTKGGGEWPDPAAPPSETAPGSDPALGDAIKEQRAEDTDADAGAEEGTAAELQPQSIRDVYDTEPSAGVTAGARNDDHDETTESVETVVTEDEGDAPA